MRSFFNAIAEIGGSPMAIFKAGGSIVVAALASICRLCFADIKAGGVGVELYYAPMLDYILAAFVIFWAGMLLLDLCERQSKENSLN